MRRATWAIAEAATRAESPSELFARIHAIVGSLMDARNLYIALYDEESGLLNFPYYVDEADPLTPPPQPLRGGLTSYVMRTGRPLLATPEVFRELVAGGEVRTIGPDSLDWLGVPLHVGTRTIGVLAVQTYSSTVRYTEEHRDILVFVSAQVALVVERMRAAEALRRSEARHRAILAALPDVCQTDLDGVFQYVSPSQERATGWSPAELLGRNLAELVHPDDLAAVRDALGSVLRSGAPATFTSRLRRRDGLHLWAETAASLARDEAGQPHAFVLGTREVTARKQSDLVLELLHEVDSRILRSLPLDAILLFLCEEMTAKLDCPTVWVGLRQPDGTVSVRAAAGTAAAFVRGISVRWDSQPTGGGPTGEAIRSGRSSMIASVADDERAVPWREQALAHGLRSVVAIPLAAGAEPFGALVVNSDRPHGFDAATVRLLERLADQVALSIVEAQHRERIELQTAALEAAANAVAITDHEGRIEWVNPAFCELTGYAADEARGLNLRELRSDARSDFFHQQQWATVASGAVWRGEVESRRKDGTQYFEEETITPVREPDGGIRHFVSIRQDVTSRRRTEERIRHLALHDSLTDLPNRRAVEENLERLVARARHGGEPATLLLLDLDHFKTVNDSVGHAAGDSVLIELANLLVGALRLGDEIARLGGDEFVVLLAATPLDTGLAIADRLRALVGGHRFTLGERQFDLGVSVGVVSVDGRHDASALLARADAALYSAKDRGRNRVALLETEAAVDTSLAQAGSWASRVKDALREGRFELYFQPVLDLSTGAVLHHEVLLRLRDEGGQIVAPGAFLPAAERFGLMPQIDRWVVGRALELLREHPALELFVNLSGASLDHEDLLRDIEQLVAGAGISPGRLGFEITETSAVADTAVAQQWMRRLRELGCRFALDDFGIGFSSFAYLQSLPADYVKIDGSFIRDLDSNTVNRALVAAIHTVARTLGKRTIAESVEGIPEADMLRQLGIELGQGYAFGRPSPQIPGGAAPA